jgi:hypothetical protein
LLSWAEGDLGDQTYDAGDTPLLGDLEGEGRDEPCVYRSGWFLCDTAGDGGAAELLVQFGAGDEVPLLGNLEGL